MIRKYLSTSELWRTDADGRDETFLVASPFPRGCRIVGVGMSARSSSSPFDPVEATCLMAAYLIPDRLVDVSGTRGTQATTLRAVQVRETLLAFTYAATVPREAYVDLSQSSHGMHGPVRDDHGDAHRLVFHWVRQSGGERNYHAYYDLVSGVGCA